MVTTPVYMDNQATTRVDARVLESMLPWFVEQYGNAGSTSHVFGWRAKDAVDAARATIAAAIGAASRELVFTSGATESNNLALRGVVERGRRRGNHIVSVATEHKALLDPLARLARQGLEVTLLPCERNGTSRAGIVDLQRLRDAIRDDTLLVSVMLANNEVGVIQPIAEIAEVCHERGVLLHSDATQAVGKLPVDAGALGVDLMSFSAHKFYGPKGIGALYVRRRTPRVRLAAQIDGGGQEHGLRSGTLNVPGIVGMSAALQLCCDEGHDEQTRLAELRNKLFRGLTNQLADVQLNGPPLDNSVRLAGNLNCSFTYVEGEALMMSMQDLAVSSGSACTSANPEPSHVLRALGIPGDQARSSLRFGLGRYNTAEEVDFAIETVVEAVQRLRKMSSLA